MLKSVADQVRTSHRKEWLQYLNKNDNANTRRIVRNEVLGNNSVVIDARCRLHILREAREYYGTSIS